MHKKLEEKILEEIRKRVLEKDSELKKQEENKLIRDANIEALTELTTLSKNEVESIAKSVRKEEIANSKKQRKKQIKILTAVLVVILIFAKIFWPEKEVIVIDDFNNNDYKWSIFNKFTYKKNIKDGYYYIETNKNGWCYWDDIPINFPENYDVHVTNLWKHGTYNSFGLMLSENDDNYVAFLLKPNGRASYGTVIKDKWVYEGDWKNNMGNKAETKKPNEQIIKVRKNKFEYYINNKLVDKGTININIKNICLSSCGEQLIAFDKVKIVNADTKELVFSDDFEKPSEKWTPSEKLIKHNYLENGELIFKTNDKSCYWSASKKHKISKNCEIELTSTWLSGESSNYGIMIMENDANYISCQLKNDGNARTVTSINSKYTNIGDYTKTQYIGNGSLKHTQKIIIKDEMIEYYVDNELITTVSLSYINPVKIGLRLCGQQSVAFDKLKIKTFE